MTPHGSEHEFGVPIPGKILEPTLWTQTALKKMPESGRLNWADLFGRVAPIVIDLGCGNGRYLLGSASARPDHDHLGIDILPVVIRYARRRGNQRGLSNLRFAVGGGRQLLNEFIEPSSVDEIHCYHPQPYYERAEVQRRLITPDFLALVHRALKPNGLFVIQTDNPGYWQYMQKIVPMFFDFVVQRSPWPDAPQGRTRREIIALQRGLPVFRGSGRRRDDISTEAAMRLAESLPSPVFDANRRLRALDQMERDR